MLVVENMGVCWQQRILLSGIHFTLQAGEVAAVIGPNGAGKSTLLKAITGQGHPYTGSVRFNGVNMKAYDPKVRAQRLAVLPQSSLLNFPFRVREVIALGRIHCAESRAQQGDIIDELLCTLDARHLADRRYTELSGGEQQRVHLVRVLAQLWSRSPSIEAQRCLLLDEPTSALDLTHQKITLDTIKALAKKERIGVLMVVHDVNLAARYADKILILQNGQIKGQGTPWEVLQEEVLKDVFHVDMRVIAHPTLSTPLLVAL